MVDIEQQLEKLREEYRKARDMGDVKSMKLIEIRAKLLKISGPPKLKEYSIEEIEDIFISNNQGG